MKKLSRIRKKSAQPAIEPQHLTNQVILSGESREITEPRKRRLIPATKYSHRELSGRILHHALSVALPISVYVFVVIFHLPWVALILVLLSKWQIFVVKPRFWWANLKFSAVDLIFKLSILSLTLLAQLKVEQFINKSTLILRILQLALVGLYLFWNLYLRKRTSSLGMAIQGLVAQLVALIALAWVSGFVSLTLPVAATIAISWLICYSAAQHILYAYEESAIPQLAGYWALFAVSLNFFQTIWAQNFIFFNSLLYIPLLPFVISAFGYLAFQSHHFIEQLQGQEEATKAMIERTRQNIIKQSGLAIGISIFLAVLIMIR